MRSILPTRPSEADIQALEQQLGFRLPDRYRALLPLLNGTFPEPNVLKLGGAEDYSIQQFEKIEDIAWSKQMLDEQCPSDLQLVPFAMDGCGNSFCIATADGPEKGAIYFAEHEIDGDEALERIADDLDAMMRGAQPNEIDPNQAPVQATNIWIKPGFMEIIREQERQWEQRKLTEKPNVFPPPTEDQG